MLLTLFSLQVVVVYVDLLFVKPWRWIVGFLYIDINLVPYSSQPCQSLMIVSMANSISRAQQGQTLPVPQSSANQPPFAKPFSFSVIEFTASIL